MTPTLQRFAGTCLGLLLTIALLPSPAVLAQQITYGTPSATNRTETGAPSERLPSVLDAASMNPTWTANIDSQIKHLLDSRNPDLQAAAVHLIHQLWLRAPHLVDHSSLRPRLYDLMYRTSAPDALRILALSALYNTDPDETVEALLVAVHGEPSNRVKRQMLLTIAAATLQG